MTTTTTPAPGSPEAALADLMSGIYEHAGRYPEDTMGELRALPIKRDCPSWCGTDHARLYAEGTPLFQAAAHARCVYEAGLSTVRNPVDGRVERVGAGEVRVNVRQDPYPHSDGGSINGAPLVELLTTPGGETSSARLMAQLDLTAGEARSLAVALTIAADHADGLR